MRQRIRSKRGREKLDTLVGKAVSDTLQKKVGEIIKDKTGKDLDDLKNKVRTGTLLKRRKETDQRSGSPSKRLLQQ